MAQRPFEETWIVPDANPDVVARKNPDGLHDYVLFAENDYPPTDVSKDAVARARLAAQAPAMARLLLLGMEITVAGPHDNYTSCLADCGSYGGPKPEDHRPDCALVAVLRAAGVIE